MPSFCSSAFLPLSNSQSLGKGILKCLGKGILRCSLPTWKADLDENLNMSRQTWQKTLPCAHALLPWMNFGQSPSNFLDLVHALVYFQLNFACLTSCRSLTNSCQELINQWQEFTMCLTILLAQVNFDHAWKEFIFSLSCQLGRLHAKADLEDCRTCSRWTWIVLRHGRLGKGFVNLCLLFVVTFFIFSLGWVKFENLLPTLILSSSWRIWKKSNRHILINSHHAFFMASELHWYFVSLTCKNK